MPRPANTSCWPPGGRAFIIVYLTRPTWWTTRNCWNWSRWKCATCSPSTTSRRQDPIITGSALKALEGDQSENRRAVDPQAGEAIDTYIPQPKSAYGPFLMPRRTCFSISGRGTVVNGRIERVSSRSAMKSRSSASSDRQTTVTGVEMFRKLLDRARPATTSVSSCAAQARGSRARPGAGQARLNQPAHQVEAEVYVLSKEEGAVTPVLPGLSPQFYFRTPT